tara:strand:- start:11563 stop:12498 length:936 start_codon:yes stop_codon:yes gene_type:complete
MNKETIKQQALKLDAALKTNNKRKTTLWLNKLIATNDQLKDKRLSAQIGSQLTKIKENLDNKKICIEYTGLIITMLTYSEIAEQVEYGREFGEHYTEQSRNDMFWYTWMHDTIIRNANPKKGDTIVDIGCGNAALSIKLAKKAKKVIGVDLSEEMINEGRKAISKLRIKNISFKLTPIEVVNFKKNSVDAVTTNLAIDHVKDKLAMAKKVYKWLKPGGKFVIGLAFKVEQRFKEIVERKRKRYPHLAKKTEDSFAEHVKQASGAYYEKQPIEFKVSPHELAAILQKAGFKTRIVPHYLPWFSVVVGQKITS